MSHECHVVVCNSLVMNNGQVFYEVSGLLALLYCKLFAVYHIIQVSPYIIGTCVHVYTYHMHLPSVE